LPYIDICITGQSFSMAGQWQYFPASCRSGRYTSSYTSQSPQSGCARHMSNMLVEARGLVSSDSSKLLHV